MTIEKAIAGEIQKKFGSSEFRTIHGQYTNDLSESFAVLVEINKGTALGVRFCLVKEDTKGIAFIYESPVFDGSVNQSIFEKIKLPDTPVDFIYYNSGSYFMGSGGGEIFGDLVDFSHSQIYSAHLFIRNSEGPQLYMADSIQNSGIGKFFQAKFKNDFPDLHLTTHDYKFVE